MDASYLSQQVNSIAGQLHGLFDEIGVPNHERDAREAELFAALSEALHNQVKLVTAEKNEMVDEAQRMITVIRQMEASLDDPKARREYGSEDSLQVTYPLTRCLQVLREKHIQMGRLHKERYEQVKKLVEALESYSSHLEPTFVRIALPPTGPNQSIPPTFDLSPAYVDQLDEEFTRVYEEYTRRVATVRALAEDVIQLWAELGTPQAQTDGAIVKYYRDAPEQLGLHEEDVGRLRGRRDRLAEEKKSRERRLRELRAGVEALWEKLGVEERERKAFVNGNRGCGVRQINEFEDELARLNELKHQNLHLFVEDARYKLQELWDALYFSEDEMLEFTPAFSDVYSDALLEAHERETARLEALREQRAPTLALVERHRTLVRDRDELATSSQDASRLMKGQRGERRDPGKLLREEKMRKRISKELPKVAADLRRALEAWEDDYGCPFLVQGERYLDVLDEDDEPKRAAPGPRSKTPAGTSQPQSAKNGRSGALSRANSTRSGAKTPTGTGTIKKAPARGQQGNSNNQSNHSSHSSNPKGSPSRIPARVPLSNLKHGHNSPERPRPESRTENAGSMRHMPPPLMMRAPPPKMRELMPPPELETPANPYRTAGLGSSIVRAVEPEDVYDDRQASDSGSRPGSEDYYYRHQSSFKAASRHPQVASMAPPPRQISNTSTAVSGSENWETYDDNSEPEPDASDAYYAKLRAARTKRMTPETGYGGQAKRQRGIPPAQGGQVVLDREGNRIMSGSEWTDEDAF